MYVCVCLCVLIFKAVVRLGYTIGNNTSTDIKVCFMDAGRLTRPCFPCSSPSSYTPALSLSLVQPSSQLIPPAIIVPTRPPSFRYFVEYVCVHLLLVFVLFPLRMIVRVSLSLALSLLSFYHTRYADVASREYILASLTKNEKEAQR